MNEENQPWYGVKVLFLHNNQLLEERVIVVKAESFDDAQAIAIQNSQEYIIGLNNTKFVAIADIFHMFNETIESGTEVFSRMNDINGDVDKYIETHYEDEDWELVYKADEDSK